MKKEISINRAKDFLRNLPHIILDESVDFENYLNFSEPNKTYYVYMDSENCGCFENKAMFMSNKEVNELIKNQMMNNDKWDHVVIFNIKTNKIIIPNIMDFK